MDYLPRSVQRVLYLDSDIIINGPLEILFNLDMAGNIIAAATDSHNHTQEVTRIKRELGLPQDFEYVNSGVLVMDIEAMRGYITTAEIINRLTVYRSRLKYPDQDLLNVLFNDKILHLDRYMYNYSPFSNCSWLDDLTAGYPAVIHFTGIKPWKPAYPTHNSFLRKAKALYEFYASLCSKRFNEKKLAE
jgi:lipopolysaccharide biosynthesis glycosyltransferase